MSEQNIDQIKEDILYNVYEVCEKTYNQLVDQLKDQFVDALLNKIQVIQNDTKELLANHPEKQQNEQVDFLMNKHQDVNITMNLDFFTKEVIANTLSAEKMSHKLLQLDTSVQAFVKQHRDKDLDKKQLKEMFQKEHATQNLLENEKEVIIKTIKSAMQKYKGSIIHKNSNTKDDMPHKNEHTLIPQNDFSKLSKVPKKLQKKDVNNPGQKPKKSARTSKKRKM